MTAAILPVEFDRDTGFFFEAAREGKLVYRYCNVCAKGFHMPTQFCGRCGGNDTEWRESNGTGRLFSWTTVTHPVHPAYSVPYTIVVVSLDDAPEVRLIGRLQGAPELVAGQPMEIYFSRLEEESMLPQWKPV